MAVTEATRREQYRQGVDCLVEGRPEEAVRLLEPLASDDSPDARLALGRAYLDLRRGEDATAQLDALLARDVADSGLRAYVHLLSASAAAFSGHREQAERHLDDAQAADARLEHAVRALRRRLRKGRAPLVRL